MAKKGTPTAKLNISLLKDSVTDFDSALRDDHSLTETTLNNTIGDDSVLYVKEPHKNPPSWAKFLATVTQAKLKLANASSSAVLFVKVDNRIFAICFGHGRNELKPEVIQNGFGLKVTLNRVNPAKLRSVDARTLENGVTTKRLQTSRDADQTAFGIDVARNLHQTVANNSSKRKASYSGGVNAMNESHAEESEPPIVGAAHWLNDCWPRIASAIGTLTLIGVGIWFSVKGKDAHWCVWLVFVISAIVWLVGEICGWRHKDRLSKLKRQLNDSEASRIGLEDIVSQTSRDYFDLLRDQLSILANDVFRFTDRERISVYKHDGKEFVMLGRYSKNPRFCQKGRGVYPDTEGCIAEAWNNGESMIEDLPDPTLQPEEYAKRLKDEWHINKQVVRSFKMQSRSYVAIAIEDGRQTRIAVVVFESTCANGTLAKDQIKLLLDSHEGKRIAQFLDRMRSLEPSPTYAHEEGY